MSGNWLLLPVYKTCKAIKICNTYKIFKICMAVLLALMLLLSGCAGAGDGGRSEDRNNSGGAELTGAGISSGSAAEGDAAAGREPDSDNGAASESERGSFRK